MADLEIRGAGNLLGDEQSGHVAAVGFEMYAQMLEEAVRELDGQQAVVAAPVRVDMPVTAYVPPEYIAYEATKIDAHRRIARARTEGELGTCARSSPTASARRRSRWNTSSRCRPSA